MKAEFINKQGKFLDLNWESGKRYICILQSSMYYYLEITTMQIYADFSTSSPPGFEKALAINKILVGSKPYSHDGVPVELSGMDALLPLIIIPEIFYLDSGTFKGITDDNHSVGQILMGTFIRKENFFVYQPNDNAPKLNVIPRTEEVEYKNGDDSLRLGLIFADGCRILSNGVYQYYFSNINYRVTKSTNKSLSSFSGNLECLSPSDLFPPILYVAITSSTQTLRSIFSSLNSINGDRLLESLHKKV